MHIYESIRKGVFIILEILESMGVEVELLKNKKLLLLPRIFIQKV